MHSIIAQVDLVVYPAYHLRALHSSVGINADGIPSEPWNNSAASRIYSAF